MNKLEEEIKCKIKTGSQNVSYVRDKLLKNVQKKGFNREQVTIIVM